MGVTSCTNAVLHTWLKQEWSDILAKLPPPIALDAETNRAVWELWRVGLDNPLPLPDDLPPLRALLSGITSPGTRRRRWSSG
jgi:hypothetical protein